MNTRDKILSATSQLEAPAMLVVGTFDPLLAAHSQRLAELAQSGIKLVVAVADLADPVLSIVARREMVAALRVVDFVVPFEPGIEASFPWTAIHDDTALHERWAVDFKNHVRRRNQ